MDAYVYMRCQPGRASAVADLSVAMPHVREAVAITGEWDVIAAVMDLDPFALGTTVIGDIQRLPGVEWTMTAPVVPLEALGLVGAHVPLPPMHHVADVVALINLNFEPTMAERVVHELSEAETVHGLAILSGPYDAIVEVGGESWDDIVRSVFADIQTVPGVTSTNTSLVVSPKHAPPSWADIEPQSS